MTGSPDIGYAEAVMILGDRMNEHPGSVWDTKPFGSKGIPLEESRYRAVLAVDEDGHSYGQVAEGFGVSKPFVSKWVRVHRARKVVDEKHHDSRLRRNAFGSLSNRPKEVGIRIDDAVRKSIVDIRKGSPFFGSAKIKAHLSLDIACSTIDKILRQAKPLVPGKRRQRNRTYGRFERNHSFSTVQIDYRSWSRKGSHSMFVLDDASRTILGHSVSDRQSSDDTIDLLERTFGLWNIRPDRVLSDHGTGFCSVRGGKGRSRPAVWCRDNGIGLIHGRVRHPRTQGKIGRSHLSAMEEMGHFGPTDTIDEFRETMGRWVEFYNTQRPHQALDYDHPMNRLLERMDPEDLESLIGC